MGLEIHALGPDGEDRMVRHLQSGITAAVLQWPDICRFDNKRTTRKGVRETADLQLFSNVKTDDDGNYINPLDGNIPDDDEEIKPRYYST